MTTRPRIKRYRTTGPVKPVAGTVDDPKMVTGETDIDAIRKEGLTGRQLRMARRVAQKHGIASTSDFDAVRQLRERGVDPFQRGNVLELVESSDAPVVTKMPRTATGKSGEDEIQLPAEQPKQTAPAVPSSLDERAGQVRQMQKDIARRRRKNLALLATRLLFFVLLPTLIAGYYFYRVATPMYATSSTFVIQQADGGGGMGGLGGMLQGTSMATQQDAISVQNYLSSREAMLRLEEEVGFAAVFTAPHIDPIQRLEDDASLNDVYDMYRKRVKLSYDPTEGLVRMEVSAPDPALSQSFSEALIRYAEQQVDQMTARLRADQMKGAEESFAAAEVARAKALAELTRVQAEAEVLDPVAENSALMGRITNLETQRDDQTLALSSLLDNRRPNQARVDATRAAIARLDEQIAMLRGQITQAASGRQSRTEVAAMLREAEENYQFRLGLVQEALSQREAARVEANRQVRYLSMSERPIAPDEPTYPRAFENTAVSFFIFAGIYLMLALTAAILREQVSS